MNTIDRRDAVLEIAEQVIETGVDNENALLDGLQELVKLRLGLGPKVLGFKFGILLAELQEQARVEERDTLRPEGVRWSDLADDAEKRVELALVDLIGGGR